jgi:1-deoxy-D-xylulose-5-phosphate reductoisomerase
MKLPISYALNYPRRMKLDFPRLDLSKIGTLLFEKPDFNKFKCLKLAYEALESGGTAPAVLNAANEVAVNAFLNNEISFLDISECIDYTINKISIVFSPDLDSIFAADKEARIIAENFVKEN